MVPATRAAKNASGRIFGFFTGMLGLQLLQDSFGTVKIGENGYMSLTDRDGTILAHTDEISKLHDISQEISDLMTNITAETAEINTASGRLSDASGELNKNVQDTGPQIDLFKI